MGGKKGLSGAKYRIFVVNGDAFNDTFDKPSQTLIGTIVSIYNSRFGFDLLL